MSTQSVSQHRLSVEPTSKLEQVQLVGLLLVASGILFAALFSLVLDPRS